MLKFLFGKKDKTNSNREDVRETAKNKKFVYEKVKCKRFVKQVASFVLSIGIIAGGVPWGEMTVWGADTVTYEQVETSNGIKLNVKVNNGEHTSSYIAFYALGSNNNYIFTEKLGPNRGKNLEPHGAKYNFVRSFINGKRVTQCSETNPFGGTWLRTSEPWRLVTPEYWEGSVGGATLSFDYDSNKDVPKGDFWVVLGPNVKLNTPIESSSLNTYGHPSKLTYYVSRESDDSSSIKFYTDFPDYEYRKFSATSTSYFASVKTYPTQNLRNPNGDSVGPYSGLFFSTSYDKDKGLVLSKQSAPELLKKIRWVEDVDYPIYNGQFAGETVKSFNVSLQSNDYYDLLGKYPINKLIPKDVKYLQYVFNSESLNASKRYSDAVDLSYLSKLEKITNSFNSSAVSEITLPDSLTTLVEAFQYSNIAKVNFGSGLVTLGDKTFYMDKALKSINLPTGIISMGNSVFEGCSSLESINIPSTVNTVGTNLLKGCTNLSHIILEDGLTTLGKQMFSNCTSLQDIELPVSFTAVPEESFMNATGLITVKLPSKIKTIEINAFSGCTNLSDCVIPQGTTTIKTGAFKDCKSLTHLVIPKSVTTIEDNAFTGMTSPVYVFENSPAYAYCVAKNVPYLIEKEVAPTGVTLSPKTELSLSIGDTKQFTANVRPSTATDKTVSWDSSDTSVGTVDEDGLFTAVGEGTTYLTVYTNAGSASDEVEINVNPALTDLQVTPTSISIGVNETKQIQAAKIPSTVTTPVAYESDNIDIASVSSSGLVTGNDVGATHITVSCGSFSKTIPVTVNAKATDIILDTTSIRLAVGQQQRVNAVKVPSNAIDAILFTANNSSISVDSDGTIHALQPGNSTVTVTCGDVTKNVQVTVVPELIDLTVPEGTVNVSMNSTATINVERVPSTGGAGDITYSSGNSSIVTVDSNGIVTPVGVGSTTIIVTCDDVTKEIPVTVAPELGDITLSETDINLIKGFTHQLQVTKDPADALGEITYESFDTSVATVDAAGLITAVGKGNTTITIKCGSVTKTVSVQVKASETTGITVPDVPITITKGETSQIPVERVPADSEDEIIYETSDSGIATVSPSGEVTAVGVGTATVTVKCGSITKTVTINVAGKPVTSLTVDVSDLSLTKDDSQKLNVTKVPADADSEVSYFTGDPSVATVDSDGNVTAVGKGSTTITIKCGAITKEIPVVVSAKVDVTDITVMDSISVNEGESVTIGALAVPSDADDASLTYEVADKSIAVVNKDGKLTGINAGRTSITVTSVLNPSISKTVLIEVIKAIEEFEPVGISVTADNTPTNDVVNIHVAITGDLKQLTLPNGNQVNADVFDYSVLNNGTYSFVAIGKDGNVETQSIKVDWIDKTAPTIRLNSEFSASGTTYTLNAIDKGSGVNSAILPDDTEVFDLPTTWVQNSYGDVTFVVSDKAGNIASKSASRIGGEASGLSTNTVGTWSGIPTQWTNKDAVILGYGVNQVEGASVGLDKSPSTELSTDISKDSLTVTQNRTVDFNIIDGAGNSTTVPLVIDKIDKDKPKAEVVQDEDGNLQIVAEDNLSGIKRIVLPDGTVQEPSISRKAKAKFMMARVGASDETGPSTASAVYSPEFNGIYRFLIEDIAGNVTVIDAVATGLTDPEFPIMPPANDPGGSAGSDEDSGDSGDVEPQESVIEVTGRVNPLNESPSEGLIRVVIPTRMDFVIDENRQFVSGDYTFENTGDKDVRFVIKSVDKLNGTATSVVSPDKFTNWDDLSREDTISNIALLLGDVSLDRSGEQLLELNAGKTESLKLTGKYGKDWGNKESVVLKYGLTIEIRAKD